jgi:hypothetical protein
LSAYTQVCHAVDLVQAAADAPRQLSTIGIIEIVDGEAAYRCVAEREEERREKKRNLNGE